jgi:N-acetylglutamate synthase-like GNAT family acetyltransferase
MANLKHAICAIREVMLVSDIKQMLDLNNATFIDGEVDVQRFNQMQAHLGLQAFVACPVSDLNKVHGFIWYINEPECTRISRILVHPAIHRCHNGYKLVTKLAEHRDCRDVIEVNIRPEDDCFAFFDKLGFVANEDDELDGSITMRRSKRWNPFPFDPSTIQGS